MKNSSYWLKEEKKPVQPLSYHGSHDFHMIVVGGGYTGLNCALALQKAGKKVLLLEKEQIGWGASCRNAGMLLAGVKAPMAKVAKQYDLSFARSLWQWTLDSIDHVRKLIAKENISCHWQDSGSLELAHRKKDLLKLQKQKEFLEREFCYKSMELVGPGLLSDEIGSGAFEGGLLDLSAASLHPGLYLAGLAKLVKEAGVTILEGASVKELSLIHI